jgi:hypothetical protein
MNHKNTSPIKVTVEGGLRPDKKIELTISAYADLEEWVEVFKTILIHQTYSEDTVKELFEVKDFEQNICNCCKDEFQ